MQEWTKFPVFAHEHHEKSAEKGAIQAQRKIEMLLIIKEIQHGPLSREESITVNSRQIGREAERWVILAQDDSRSHVEV